MSSSDPKREMEAKIQARGSEQGREAKEGRKKWGNMRRPRSRSGRATIGRKVIPKVAAWLRKSYRPTDIHIRYILLTDGNDVTNS